ncbi:hypothetical protein IWQ62_006108, partial [Dispira parvispora]
MLPTARGSLSLITSPDEQIQLLTYGGDTPYGTEAGGPLWSYTPEGDSWKMVKLNRTLPWRSGHTAVTDTLRNRVYFYGGKVRSASSISRYVDNKEFSVLDVSVQPWHSTSHEFSVTGTIPGVREDHGAVLLNNTHFLLLGGLTTAKQPANARVIYLFDIPNQRWSYRSTQGAIPSKLSSFTLNVYKNMLIIYGGRTTGESNNYYDQFLTLDTSQPTWTWERKTPVDAPPGRYGHGAVLFDKYLLITFGYTSEGPDHSLYVLDVETFRMVDTVNIEKESPSTSPSSDIPTWKIVVIVVASVLGLLLLLGIGWCCFRRRRRRSNEEEEEAPTVSAGTRGIQALPRNILDTSPMDQALDEDSLVSRTGEQVTPSPTTTPLTPRSASSLLQLGPFIPRLNFTIPSSATDLLGLPQRLVNREINLPTPMEVPNEPAAHRVEL